MRSASVSITFDNQLSDYLAAERLYYKSTFGAKLDKIAAAILSIAGALWIWLAGFQWWSLIPFLLAMLEWFNLLSVRPLVIWYWFSNNPKFRETYHLTFDETGIHFQTDSIDSRIKWDHYTNMLENGRICLLVYGTRMYSVIPKRAFTSDEDLAQFRSLTAAHIKLKTESAI